MEIASSLLTSLASTFGAAAPAAATAAPSLMSGSTLFSVLQGTATALSVVGGLRAGQEMAFQRDMQAEDAKTEAAMEGTRGTERRTAIKRQMLEDLGARDVAYAASNVDLAFGTPAVARQQAVADANNALSTDAETQTIRQTQLMRRSAAFKAMAEEARSSATLKAIGGGLSFASDLGRRK